MQQKKKTIKNLQLLKSRMLSLEDWKLSLKWKSPRVMEIKSYLNISSSVADSDTHRISRIWIRIEVKDSRIRTASKSEAESRAVQGLWVRS
jgi:hypothetical protein